MKKIKSWLFPQKGKEKSVVRFYIVFLYVALIFGIIFSFVYFLNQNANQNILRTDDVQYQLSWALLDSTITQNTVSVFVDAKISGSDADVDLSEYDNGYEYKYYLLYNEIPKLAAQADTVQEAANIRKVGDILEKNIEEYSAGRLEVFSPSSAIIEGLLMVLIIVIPLFIFFRAVVYRILLYIVFGNAKVKNNIT
jgi:Na+-transporting NADH:ubiquinone oxidoreductase subunit NqrC